MHLKLRLLSLFIGFSSLSAQTGSIGGFVKQENGEAIPFANVYLANAKMGAVSGNDGKFQIEKVPVGGQSVIAQFIGFERAVKKVQVTEGDTADIILILKESDLML